MKTEAATLRLLRAMRKIARVMDLRSAAIRREVGLTLPQLIVLACLQERGEATSRTIANDVGLSPPTVVGILEKLSAKELVQRTRSTNDRRAVLTRLTEVGSMMLASAPPLLGDSFADRLEAMPRGDLQGAIDALEQIATLADNDEQLDSSVT